MGTDVLFIRICVSRWRISWFYAAPTLGVGVFMSFLFFCTATNVCNVFGIAKYFREKIKNFSIYIRLLKKRYRVLKKRDRKC